jgi:hypothetical protein
MHLESGDSMANWISRTRVGILATLATPFLIFGCAGIHLYDAGKDSTAKDVKTKYTELKLPGVIAIEQQNLAALLEEELAAVREAHSLRLDLALLRIIDDDEPIGATITGRTMEASQTRPNSFSRRLTELGYADIVALRAFLAASALLSSRAEAVGVRDDLIYAKAGRRAPACGAPDSAKALNEILGSVTDPVKRGMLEIDSQAYERACAEYLAEERRQEATLGAGEVSRAYADWRSAQTALAGQRLNAQELEQSLKKASEEYEAAIKVEQAAGTSENRARVEKAAGALRDTLKQAGKASDAVGVPALSGSRIQAIDTVLTVLSGGRIDDKRVSEPDVRQATLVAGEVPALVGEIDVFAQHSRAPAVSPLVIEKQHQLLLRDDALRRVSFAVQRVSLLETKYNALVAEARYLLAQHDSVCNVLQPADAKKRIKCDTLQASLNDNTWTCTYRLERTNEAAPPMPQDCAKLGLTWGQGLRDGTPPEKRALWEAIAGLGGRLAIARPLQDETDLRLAHLSHLEVAASDEFAIRAWDGLISTPVNQLAAYHQTGIKPAELADLIVKAIGLGAIGIGVNR